MMEVNEVTSAAVQSVSPNRTAPVQQEQWQKEVAKAGGINAAPSAKSSPSETLTRAEQAYFEELFPTAARELQAYTAYRQDGSRNDASVGTVVDRKG